MKIGIKFWTIGMVVSGLLFFASSTPSVGAVKGSIWDIWPSTIYYMARLSGPNAPYTNITVHITAVDSYRLWVNGVEQTIQSNGSPKDADWSTAEQYTVPINGKDVIVAVQVNNSGAGLGTGLLVDIEAGADWLGTTTLKRKSVVVGTEMKTYPVTWYYYFGDIVAFMGTDWYKVGYKPAGTTYLDDTNYTKSLGQVTLGHMGEIDYHPNTNAEIVTGYPGDVDFSEVEDGGITLRRIDGENLALNKSADQNRVVDGDITLSGYLFNSDALNFTFWIDLGNIYRVNRTVIYTAGQNANNWFTQSLRGYSTSVSLVFDSYYEVGVIHDIGITNANSGGYNYATVDFPEEWARYIQIRVTESRTANPYVGEIMVYGTGYNYTGDYESDWLDLGSPSTQKNFTAIKWENDIPNGTNIVVQTKSKNVYRDKNGALQTLESPWSAEYAADSSSFLSPEPATAVKYRLQFSTQDVHRTPALKSFSITYSDSSQPLLTGSGYVYPNRIPMGVDTTLVYTVAYSLLSGQNIKNIVIAVPTFSSVTDVYSTDGAGKRLTVGNTAGYDVIYDSTIDSLYVTFADSITNTDAVNTDSLYISLKTKLYQSSHKFTSSVFNSSNNDNAGGMYLWENTDLGSWSVAPTGFTEGIVKKAKAAPKVFTPNNDNKNDFTVIEFTLAKVSVKVQIKIYDTKGSLVRTLWDDILEPRDWFIPDSEKFGNAAMAKNMPGYWNGKDEDGDIVPPGIYLYQVIAKTDSGDKIESGSVVVAY